MSSILVSADDEFYDADDDGFLSDSAEVSDQFEDATFYDAARTIDDSEDRTYSDYPAHAAAFEGDAPLIGKLLEHLPREQLIALDPQGNTVLHVAVLKQHIAAVDALLELGFPLLQPNSRGWLALDEAVALKHERLVRKLYYACLASMKATMKSKRGDMLQSMYDMPDHNLSLSWELGSSFFGVILRRYAPHDTYQVWKRGVQVRVDGTLMGIDSKSSSLIPQWKRGQFSLLFDGRCQPASIKLLDRRKQTFIDVQAEKRVHKTDKEAEVRKMLSGGVEKTKVKTSDFHFKPAKTLFGNESTEKVSGWKTRVYEATGKLIAVSITKAAIRLSPSCTFEEYCAMTFPVDARQEIPIDPLSMKGIKMSKTGDRNTDSEMTEAHQAAEVSAQKHGGRKFTARCWMAESFPISLQQLLPILDVIGEANKYMKKAGRFMAKYGSKSLFPVKLQVPLLFTVYAVIQNRSFRLLNPGEEAMTDEFYELPSGCTLKRAKGIGSLGPAVDEDFS